MGWRPDGTWDEPVKLLDLPFRPNVELVRRSLWLFTREGLGTTSPLWAKHEAPPVDEADEAADARAAMDEGYAEERRARRRARE